MPAFFAVLGRELRDAVASPLGQRVTTIHLALALAAVLLGWPVSYVLGQAQWAPAISWWAATEIVVLSYLALAVPADALPLEDEIRPGDWITYGHASPLAVQVAQTLAAVLAIAFWLLTALPAALLGSLLSPLEEPRLMALGGFAALLFLALIQVGTWIGVTINERTYRVVAVDIAFAALMLGTLLVQITAADRGRLSISAHPLQVTAQILNITAQEALFGSAAGTLAGLAVQSSGPGTPLESIPWLYLIAVYGGIFLVAGVLSVFSLRQWEQHHDNPSVRG